MDHRSFHINTTPGPGAYDSFNSIDPRGAVTSRSPRFSFSTAASPGPSSYHPKSPTSPFTPGSTFSKSQRFTEPKPFTTPGPGRYDSFFRSSGPAFSISHKNPQNPFQTPGPGAYSPKFIVKKSPTRTIGTAKRADLALALNTPGPGRYKINEISFSPKWSFKGRHSRPQSLTPGPGRYETFSPRSTGFTTPKASRELEFGRSGSPGPGAYETRLEKADGIRYSIGKGKRSEVNSKTPGPGRYNLQTPGITGFKFGKQERKWMNLQDTPSGSNYSPKGLDKTPAFSFGQKLLSKNPSAGPGPGAYNPDKNVRAPGAKFSKSLRFIKNFTEKDANCEAGNTKFKIGLVLVKKEKAF